MSGIAGQFFKQFGITVSVQVLFSLLAARLVTPMLAAYFLQASSRIDEQPPGARAARLYQARHLVGAALPHHRADRLRLFAASIWSIALLPQGLLAGPGHRTIAAGDRAAAGFAAFRHREGHRGDRRATAQAARRSRASSSMADGCRRGRTGVRRAALIINYTPKTERTITQRELELAIGQRARKRSRHPLLVPRRKRPARDHRWW